MKMFDGIVLVYFSWWPTFELKIDTTWKKKQQKKKKKKKKNENMSFSAFFGQNPTLGLTLSHLGAHLVNRLLDESRKSIPNFLKGKKLLKNVTLQILNYIPVS